MTDRAREIRHGLTRLIQWCQHQDPTATIWLHAAEARDFIEALDTNRAVDQPTDVERVARAICRAFNNQNDDQGWKVWRPHARAAIRAMPRAPDGLKPERPTSNDHTPTRSDD